MKLFDSRFGKEQKDILDASIKGFNQFGVKRNHQSLTVEEFFKLTEDVFTIPPGLQTFGKVVSTTIPVLMKTSTRTRYYIPDGLVREFMDSTTFKGSPNNCIKNMHDGEHIVQGSLVFQNDRPIHFVIVPMCKWALGGTDKTYLISHSLVDDKESDPFSSIVALSTEDANGKIGGYTFGSLYDFVDGFGSLGILNSFVKFALYMDCFPEAIRDGVPDFMTGMPKGKQKNSHKTLLPHERLKRACRGSVCPHIRSGYYKTYTHERYVHVQGQTVYVNAYWVGDGINKTAEEAEELTL